MIEKNNQTFFRKYFIAQNPSSLLMNHVKTLKQTVSGITKSNDGVD